MRWGILRLTQISVCAFEESFLFFNTQSRRLSDNLQRFLQFIEIGCGELEIIHTKKNG